MQHLLIFLPFLYTTQVFSESVSTQNQEWQPLASGFSFADSFTQKTLINESGNCVMQRPVHHEDGTTTYTSWDINDCLPQSEFGAYQLLAKGELLIAGLSQSPLEQNGAALYSISTDGTAEHLTNLKEQGITQFIIVSDKVLIPGADPAWPEYDHSYGNFYTYSLLNNSLTTIRTLERVIHGLDLSYDSISGTLYYAGSRSRNLSPGVGGMVGSGSEGVIYRSQDMGLTWELFANSDRQPIGEFRTYGVASSSSGLYALGFDFQPAPQGLCHLVQFAKNAVDQINVLSSRRYNCRVGLIKEGNLTMAYDVIGRELNIIDTAAPTHSVDRHPLPFALKATYDPITIAPDSSTFYFITQNNEVVKTSDFQNFKTVFPNTNPNLQVNSIAYWEAKNSLVISVSIARQVYFLSSAL